MLFIVIFFFFFFSSRRRHTRCALVTEFRRVLFRSRQDDRQNDENDGAEAEEPERVGQQQAKGDLEGAGQPRLGDGCGLGRRHHSFSLMRGSSAALTRSAMVVETTNKTVVISTPPMTTG